MRLLHALMFALVPCSVMAVGCAAEPDDEFDEATASEDELVAKFDRSTGIDLSKRTRILLVGDSDKLGSLPLHSATARAKRYQELYPSDQIVLFVTQDVRDATVASTGATVLNKGRFGTLGPKFADFRRLDSSKLMSAMDRFAKIASIDFFGHSSPFSLLLESAGGNERKLSASIPGNANILKDNFDRAANPYVTLNGCNGGNFTAPQLSKLWGVPVSGALTGSNFQELMSDNEWYFNDEGFFPSTVRRAGQNTVSFASPKSCSGGACVRMKPQDSPYAGVWAHETTRFQYGLNFYKFFCDYDDPANTCAKGMAQSLYGNVSDVRIDKTATDAQAQEALVDVFCSRTADATWFTNCRTNLLAAVAGNLPFSGMKGANDYTLECDFKRCEQKFRCTTVNGEPQKKTCAWVSADCAEGANPASCRKKNTKKATTVNEFKRYMEGHKLLRGG
jgi:hypothetical protein